MQREKLDLRDYQLDGLDRFSRWYATVNDMEALIALTMGMGKTITAAACVNFFLEKIKPGGKILWLTHREELIDQSKAELELYTGQYCEIEKAGQKYSGLANIVVASVQTLRGRRLHKLSKEFYPDLIICDEAHHALALTWMQVKQTYAKAKVLNLTATPFRSDISQRLELGTVLLEKNTTDGIRMGILVPPKAVGKLEIDLGNIKKRLGDYDVKSLAEVLCRPEILAGCMSLIKQNCIGKRSILFAASVQHGKIISSCLRESGFKVGEIYGDTPTEERQGYFKQIKAREIDIIVNNLVLTEGLNIPELEAVIMLRPTRNAALYLQAIGRGLRVDPKNPDKKFCLIIDILDTAKRKGGETVPMPTEDDVRMYSALNGRSACAPEVFLSWFYRADEMEDLLEGTKRVQDLTKLNTPDLVYKQLAPPWMAHLDVNPAAEILQKIWTPHGTYKDLTSPFRSGSAEAFKLMLTRKGWIYLPHNQLPKTEEELEEHEIEALPAEVEGNYTLQTLISQDAKLKNFILDLFDPNQSLKDQAAKCYEMLPIAQSVRNIAWFNLINKTDVSFHFIQWKDGDYNTILVRDSQARVYCFQQPGKRKLEHKPGFAIPYSRLPDFVKGTSWADRPMSEKQAGYVAKILHVSEVEANTMRISKLSASALMSNQWNKAHLKTIALALATGNGLVPIVYTEDGMLPTEDQLHDAPGIEAAAPTLPPAPTTETAQPIEEVTLNDAAEPATEDDAPPVLGDPSLPF